MGAKKNTKKSNGKLTFTEGGAGCWVAEDNAFSAKIKGHYNLCVVENGGTRELGRVLTRDEAAQKLTAAGASNVTFGDEGIGRSIDGSALYIANPVFSVCVTDEVSTTTVRGGMRTVADAMREVEAKWNEWLNAPVKTAPAL